MTKEMLLIINNGGAYTLTWPASITWVKGVEPVLSASGTDVISLILLGDSVTWLGSLNTSGSIFIDGGTWD